MAERRIHTMWKMIAIRDGGYVLAVFPNDFAELVEKLLPDLDTFERISFKMAVSPISAAGSRAHAAKIPEWEAIFISRLKQRMPDVGHLLTFSLKADEVARYLPDILEGYRGNHLDTFAFSIDDLHGADAAVLTVDVYDAPSLWHKFTKAVREPRQRYVLAIADIRAIVGTSMQMELKTRTSTLRLMRDGFIMQSSAEGNAG